jgi:hypothetical protein
MKARTSGSPGDRSMSQKGILGDERRNCLNGTREF